MTMSSYNHKAEDHWYEVRDEKVEMKVKRYFDDEGSVQK